MITFIDPDQETTAIDLELVSTELIPGLRHYQQQAYDRVGAGWGTYKTQLVTMATGAGKTPFMGAVARANYNAGGRTLMLAHTDELIEQGLAKFSSLSGLPCAKEKAEDRALLEDRVVVGSVQTLCRPARLDSWPKDHFSLVMVDECHRSLAEMYQRVLRHFDTARVLGVTATADRGDKKMLGEFYENLAFDYSMLNAVKDGWLVRPIVKTLQLEIDVTTVKTRATSDGADLNPTHLGHILEPLLDIIARAIWAEASDRKVLVFMPNVELSEKMSAAMTRAGFRSSWVSGMPHCTPRERTERQAAYARNELNCLVNAMLLTEGWDQDDVDCIVCLRATQIRALYQQMVGRGTRPLKEIVPLLQRTGGAEGAEERCRIIANSRKPHVLLLDPLWLYEKHDLTTPACLVLRNEEEVRQMKGKQGDLIANQEAVAKDFLENLRKELAKNRNRRSAMIDPLTFAVAIGDAELANYEPRSLWDLREPTAEQLRVLEAEGIESGTVKWRGQAELTINIILKRKERGLCSVRTMNFLKRHGIDATVMTADEANRKQRALFANFSRK